MVSYKALNTMSKSLNCTFMELKSESEQPEPKEPPGLNCTFMELKFLSSNTESTRGEVLIVPLWN